ncbi:TIGR01621 family pseudouridine synthase [Aliagarivorans taiwanensis]|uniref:TIGR01621 family pseudouridine synthase n=1 Tax=Aliagarivorans taiwanensis TaxID=561966 RepID=UPI0004054C2E|nr:TIGR01621 family pseudouridine synthase [Aliagarivorans taiwanensis]
MNSLTKVLEHRDFIVISKPSGLNFHSEDGELGVVERARQQFECELWPVHRLDKLTSGLLILATNKAAAAHFQELFSQGLINKYYLALASAKPKKKQGLVKGDMQKGRNGSWLLARSQDNPAITQFFSYSLAPQRRLFLLKPHTGRTHQLRVAMKSVGAPILGDKRYSGEDFLRGCLHAYALDFDWQGEQIQLASAAELFECEGLSEQLTVLSEPWQVSFPKLKG